MKLYLKIFLIWLLSQAECWKPVSHPAAFSVHQTFPDLSSDPSSRSSYNNVIQKDSVDSLLDSFNKNDFINDVSKIILHKHLNEDKGNCLLCIYQTE